MYILHELKSPEAGSLSFLADFSPYYRSCGLPLIKLPSSFFFFPWASFLVPVITDNSK